MLFTVPPFSYAIRLEPDPIRTPDGRTVVGLVEYQHHLIRLDAGLPPARLEHVLRHELVHAWVYEMAGEDMGEESRTQLSATCGMMFDREFNAQGGRDALGMLAIRARLGATHDEELVACRHCGHWHAAARSVLQAPSPPDPSEPDEPACRRTLACDRCGRVTEWIESCHEGRPTGWELRRIQ